MSETVGKLWEEEYNAATGNETCKVKPGFAAGILVALIIITILTNLSMRDIRTMKITVSMEFLLP